MSKFSMYQKLTFNESEKNIIIYLLRIWEEYWLLWHNIGIVLVKCTHRQIHFWQHNILVTTLSFDQ